MPRHGRSPKEAGRVEVPKSLATLSYAEIRIAERYPTETDVTVAAGDVLTSATLGRRNKTGDGLEKLGRACGESRRVEPSWLVIRGIPQWPQAKFERSNRM